MRGIHLTTLREVDHVIGNKYVIIILTIIVNITLFKTGKTNQLNKRIN